MHSDNEDRRYQEALATEKVFSERKVFFFDLMENARGRFLKLTEDVGGKRDTIMIPATAFDDMLEAFERIAEADKSME